MNKPIDNAAVLGIPGLSDLHPIGQGGYAIVYKAYETDLHRTVAVKVLQATLTDHAKLRFDRERRAMGALSDHPHIVTVYRGGHMANEQPYLIMELLEGGSLAEQLAYRGPLRWERVVEVGVQISGALETAHRAGVLHRDIKPGNILMSNLGQAKLADFGIARLQGSPNTRTGLFSATLTHAPPEVMSGSRPDARADIYSFGSTLYELLSGTPAFVRPSDESMAAIVARIATEEPARLDERQVPTPVMDVVVAAMAKDPANRPGSAVELADRLRSVQRQLGLLPTPLLVESINIDESSPETGQRITLKVGGPPPNPTGAKDVKEGRATGQAGAAASHDLTSVDAAPSAGSAAGHTASEQTVSMAQAEIDPTASRPTPFGPAATSHPRQPVGPPGDTGSPRPDAGDNGWASTGGTSGPHQVQPFQAKRRKAERKARGGGGRIALWVVGVVVVASIAGAGIALALQGDLLGGDSTGEETEEAGGVTSEPDPTTGTGSVTDDSQAEDTTDPTATTEDTGTTGESALDADSYAISAVSDPRGIITLDAPDEWSADPRWRFGSDEDPADPVTDGDVEAWFSPGAGITGGFLNEGGYLWVDRAPLNEARSSADAQERLESFAELRCGTAGPVVEWSGGDNSGFQRDYSDCPGEAGATARHYAFTSAQADVLFVIVVHVLADRDLEAAERMAASLTVNG